MTDSVRKPGYSALRKGRIDLPYARYFLTIALRRPLPPESPGLNEPILEQALISQSKSIRTWELLSITVMPDHLHVLVRLVDSPLWDSVRKLKGPMSKMLRAAGLAWEKSFYDHRLRPDEKVEATVRYMWLNPYRAGLTTKFQPWSGWWCDGSVAHAIGDDAQTTPPPEWWR